MHRANSAIAAGVMLAESDNLVRPLPGLLDGLNRADCNRLRAIGREKALEAGQLVWSQGDAQAGIYLISEGRIRSYYAAPSGREVTLAYWFPGNFVGGPDIFGTGPHMWTSVAAERSRLTFMPGPALRRLSSRASSISLSMIECCIGRARCLSRTVDCTSAAILKLPTALP